MNQNLIAAPNHSRIRAWCRRLGPIILALGIIFGISGMLMVAIGFGSAMISDGPKMGGQPSWGVQCFGLGLISLFVTMPFLFVGTTLAQWGFLQDIQQYAASESAPLVKDTINYLGEAVQPGIKSVTKAVSEGFMEAQEQRTNQ